MMLLYVFTYKLANIALPMAMAQQEYAICLQNCVADLVKELKVYGCSLSSDISIVTVAEVLMAAP